MARTRGCLWLTAGVIVAILAGVVAFVVLSRSSASQASETGQPAQRGPAVQAVVATQAIPIGTQLTADLVEERELPVTALPENYVASLEDAEGKIALTDLVAGEVLLAQRLADPNLVSGDGRVALVLSEGEVLMAFPIADLMSRIGVLKPGDHVDMLELQAVLLTVTPQDALVLKYVMDAGGVVDIVVRAPGDDGPVETEPVDVDYLLNRYQIPNAVGR